jgi:hypothetical protein
VRRGGSAPSNVETFHALVLHDRERSKILKKILNTNVLVAAATLLILLCQLPFREIIPRRDGIGYDGIYYAQYTQNLSFGVLLSPNHERPESVSLTTYYARRILPSMALHYAMRAFGIDRTFSNIITAFTVLNILLLAMAVFWWCLAADELGIGVRGKWLGFLALIVNYVNLKMPLFYPVLTDSAAFAFGAAALLLYMRRRPVGLLVLTLAGFFVWPTIPYFGLLLLIFPRGGGVVLEPAPRGLQFRAAGVVTVIVLAFTGYLLISGYEITSTPVKPMRHLVPLSMCIVGMYLFFGLRLLMDSKSLWTDLGPARIIRRPWFWIAGSFFVGMEVLVRSIDAAPTNMTHAKTVSDTFFTSITEPGIFFVAHTLLYGPLVLLLLFLWRPISENIRRQGTGLVLCFALALVMSVGSESRKLLNFYPFVALFLVLAAERFAGRTRRLATLAVLSLILSKIWLPMAREITLPFFGTFSWFKLYASSRGPWIDRGWYTVQLLVILAVALPVYLWCARERNESESPQAG